MERQLTFAHIGQKLLLRIDEAAAMLSVSEDQVRKFLDDGRLEARSISGVMNPERTHVRVTRASVEKFAGISPSTHTA